MNWHRFFLESTKCGIPGEGSTTRRELLGRDTIRWGIEKIKSFLVNKLINQWFAMKKKSHRCQGNARKGSGWLRLLKKNKSSIRMTAWADQSGGFRRKSRQDGKKGRKGEEIDEDLRKSPIRRKGPKEMKESSDLQVSWSLPFQLSLFENQAFLGYFLFEMVSQSIFSFFFLFFLFKLSCEVHCS